MDVELYVLDEQAEPNNHLSDVIMDYSDDVIKRNLLVLLEKKMTSLQISAQYHEVLANRYRWRSMLVNYSSILITGISFILSTVMGHSESSTNVPLAISSGLALVIKGSQQYCDFGEMAKAHAQNLNTATDLADDIDFIILKNNHTTSSLQRVLDVHEERIKSFRKTETPVPLSIKHRHSLQN